jgi:hypothetical protein
MFREKGAAIQVWRARIGIPMRRDRSWNTGEERKE